MEQVDMKLVHELAFSLVLSVTNAAGIATRAQQTPTKPVSRQKSGKQSLATPRENEIERGRYLVNELARCSDCHTPRDSNGALGRSAWLQGAPIWVMPAQSKETWAMSAPGLVGFPYSDQQAQDIL